jgi:hypothetical protein
MTVTTMSATTAAAKTASGLPTGLVLVCLSPIFLLGLKRGRPSFLAIPLLFCAFLVCTGVSGCSGISTQTTTPVMNRVPKGTYTVTVTATSGSNTVLLPITIDVNS